MSDFNNSTEMSLPIPTVGIASGPAWASLLDSCLTIIDGHNHTPGRGAPVPAAGLNINADLSMISNNLTNIRSLRFTAQSSVALAADLGCLYEIGADLYYRDGLGNQVRITQSGSVTGSAGTITGLPSGTASAVYDAIGGTFTFESATGIAANIDVGSIFIRNTSPNSTNAVTLQASAGLASNYALTLPPVASGSDKFVTVSSSGVMSSLRDVDNSTIEVSSNLVQLKDHGTTQVKLALRTTGTTVAAGGVAISTASGSFTTTSTSLTDITNLTVTIITTGRPVFVGLIGGYVGAACPTGDFCQAIFALLRGSTNLTGSLPTQSGTAGSGTLNPSVRLPAGAVYFVDVGATAGTYTYKAQALATNLVGGNRAECSAYLVAYEL